MRNVISRRRDGHRRNTLRGVVALAAVGLLAATATPAAALVGSTPDATIETNGTVNAVATAGGDTLLGGSFSRAGIPTSKGADLSSVDGVRNAAFARPDSTVDAVVSDGAGGWFVAGDFFHVGALARNAIAHLRADGSVDPAFDPNIVDGVVFSLALSGGKLYAGGSFSTVNGATTRNRLAAFDVATGTATSFDPNVGDGIVRALTVAGATLYASGNFTTVNGATTRHGVAAFDTTTGTATSFNPNVTGGSVNALALSGTTLYAGGSFASVNGSTTRNRLAAFDTGTGTATSFDPNVSTGGSTVSAVLVSGATVYAGGDFSTVNATVARAGLAAFGASDGSVVAGFDPGLAGTPQSCSATCVNALALSGTTLYAGGEFTTVNAGATSRNRLAAFSTTDGSVVAGFDPNVDGPVDALALAGTRIYAGGEFLFANADSIHSNLVAMKPDGTLDPAFSPSAVGTVNALLVSGATVYVGSVPAGGGDGLLALDTSTGALLPGFTAKITSGQVSALTILDGGLFAGGSFTSVNSGLPSAAPRNFLAKLDPATGIVDTTFNNRVSAAVTALTGFGGKVYAGGLFVATNCPAAGGCTATTGGVTVRNRIAAFDETSGAVDATFNPSLSGQVNALVASSGGRLYVGGAFVAAKCPNTGACTVTTSGVTVRNRLAAFDPPLSTAVATFDPNVNNTVSALALAGPLLYAGGSFTRVNCTVPGSCGSNGTAIGNIAAFDTTAAGTAPFGSGTLLAGFDPGMGGLVKALAASTSRLDVGGTFQTVAGLPRIAVAQFSEPAAAPSVVTGASSAITTSGASLAGTVDPHGVSTAYVFEYGPSLSFGSITTPDSVGSATGAAPVSRTLTGLAPHTTYYYRLVATSSGGTTFGAVQAFTTAGTPAAPIAVTLAVTSAGNSTATLAGTVNPSGQQAAYTFEYGTSTSFGTVTPVVALDSAFADEPVSASLSGLAADTTYYYRVVAANATGTGMGVVRSFTTGPGGAPIVTTGTASAVTASGATLSATVDPHGSATTFVFEYGTSISFGSMSAVDNADGTFGSQAVSLPVSGLSPGTTYLYRIVATNASGMSAGVVHSFTTSGAA